MAKKSSPEDQVTLLQKQFGGLVKLAKELKTSVVLRIIRYTSA